MNLRFIGSNTLAFLFGLLIMFIIIRFTLSKKCPKSDCPSCHKCPVCESKEEFARKRGEEEASGKKSFWTINEVLQHMHDDANNEKWPSANNLNRVNKSYMRATEYNTRFGLPDGTWE